MWWKIAIVRAFETFGCLSALICIVTVFYATSTVFFTILSGLGFIYVIWAFFKDVNQPRKNNGP